MNLRVCIPRKVAKGHCRLIYYVRRIPPPPPRTRPTCSGPSLAAEGGGGDPGPPKQHGCLVGLFWRADRLINHLCLVDSTEESVFHGHCLKSLTNNWRRQPPSLRKMFDAPLRSEQAKLG